MQQSGKRSPCPSCGRDSDGDCRFSDQVVLCHSGKRFAPPKHLRIGDVITLQGRPWELVATDKGYDGAAHVFKPHRPHRQQIGKALNLLKLKTELSISKVNKQYPIYAREASLINDKSTVLSESLELGK